MSSNTEGGASGRLVEMAYTALRGQILSIELAPGVTIAEADLTARLGMSRTPLREAIGRLAYEGLIVTLPRRGIRVIPITPCCCASTQCTQ